MKDTASYSIIRNKLLKNDACLLTNEDKNIIFVSALPGAMIPGSG